MPSDPNPDLLDGLCRLFYPSTDELARFEWLPVDAMPEAYRGLLAHQWHMTVAVQRHHQCPVDLRVLAMEVSATHYARQILLTRQRDEAVVQFGIMHVALARLDDRVRREIETQSLPLGRILISHDVLRHVELVSLYRVVPAAKLRSLLKMKPDQVTFGRTARIHVERDPAVELLEIVAPIAGPLE